MFLSVAMFSRPSLLVLGSCTKSPMNPMNSEESVKNSQTDNLPVTSLGSSHWFGFGSALVIILRKSFSAAAPGCLPSVQGVFETWQALDEWQRRQQSCTAASVGVAGGMEVWDSTQ